MCITTSKVATVAVFVRAVGKSAATNEGENNQTPVRIIVAAFVIVFAVLLGF